MPGFNYGGFGDGTDWSSERGDGTTPGGGSTGNSGNNSGGGSSSTSNTPEQNQLAAIYNDPAVSQKLAAMMKAAKVFNPAAVLTIEAVSEKGTLSIAANGLTADQAKQIGLGGTLIGFNLTDGTHVAVGDFETGHVLTAQSSGSKKPASKDQITGSLLGVELQVLQGTIPPGYLMQGGKVGKMVDKYTTISIGHGEHQEVYAGKVFSEIPTLTEAYNTGVQKRQEAVTEAAKAKAAAAAADKQRQDAINAAAIAGQNMTVSQAQANLNTATSNAASLKTAANNARTTAAQKKQAAATAETAALTAENTYKDLLSKTTGKSPAGTSYSVKNGTFGYQKTITRDTAEHTLTYTTWVSTGIKVAQRDAAQADATNKRNTAQSLAAQATAAAQASAAADATASNAETSRLAAAAALTAAQKEAARLKAEADAKAAAAAAAAEAARLEAEKAAAMQARQAAADKVKSADVQAVRGIATASAPAAFPMAWSIATEGSLALDATLAAASWSRISAALAELRGIAAASMVGPVATVIAGLLYSEKVGVGSDQVPGRDISAMIPGNALGIPDATTLSQAADKKSTVSMPVRGHLAIKVDGVLETQLVRTPVAGNVPVARAVLDKATGFYGYTLPAMPGVPSQTILVSPADAPGINGPLTLSGPVPVPETITHTGGQIAIPTEAITTTTPVPDELDFRDLILIFPTESGLQPVYIMYRSPRNMPGVTTGAGKVAGSNWLGAAGAGTGAALPSQIASKLRGQTFSSFDSFRQAFWRAVAADPDLSKQFTEDNLARMKRGRSPVVDFEDAAGKRISIELHHILEISQGGPVYDMDNLNAVTPKRHIDIHKGK